MYSTVSERSDRLLAALAEQLKLPLIQIARRAEFEKNYAIASTAEVALHLIDGYILSINSEQSELLLEPVAVGAVLQDVAQRLQSYAKDYSCELTIELSGKFNPVMANRQNLLAAYTLLGYSFIEAQASSGKKGGILLAAHKTSRGILAGIFCDQPDLSSDMFQRSRSLYGDVRQPLSTLSTNSGAGIFIADSLLQSMTSPLRISQHHKLKGLAATLLPSQQLQLNVS